MQFAIDEAYLPATLTSPPMSDMEFSKFCDEYPDYFIEMTSDGDILILPPNFSLTGCRNQKINTQLDNNSRWERSSHRGFHRLLAAKRCSPLTGRRVDETRPHPCS